MRCRMCVALRPCITRYRNAARLSSGALGVAARATTGYLRSWTFMRVGLAIVESARRLVKEAEPELVVAAIPSAQHQQREV